MRRLEERLGVQLLARSTRSVSTTQAGERLLARLNPAINEISTAVEQLGEISGRPSGHIRITGYDIAGKGTADQSNFVDVLRLVDDIP